MNCNNTEKGAVHDRCYAYLVILMRLCTGHARWAARNARRRDLAGCHVFCHDLFWVLLVHMIRLCNFSPGKKIKCAVTLPFFVFFQHLLIRPVVPAALFWGEGGDHGI
jgi:hypothetical protein